MDFEITPEPPAEEREALERVLADLLDPPAEPVSAWWRRGVEENVFGEAPGYPASGRWQTASTLFPSGSST